MQPLCVGDFQKGLGIKNTEIVDEHIRFRRFLEKCIHAVRRAEICGDAARVRAGHALTDFFERLGDAGLRAAVRVVPYILALFVGSQCERERVGLP